MRSNRAVKWLAWMKRAKRPYPSVATHVEFAGITPARCTELCQRPEMILELHRCSGIKNILPSHWRNLSGVQECYLFACAVAHNMKPYGPGCDPSLVSMLNARSLDCSNYGLLMHYLAAMCLAGTANPSPVFVGWNDGAVGNHQMVLLNDGNEIPELILDPTSGLAVRASFNHVAAGHPVAAHDIIATMPTKQLEASRQNVVEAFLKGAFRPSDLLYYFDGVDHLLNRFGNSLDWPTPGAVSWREQQRNLRSHDDG